MTDREKAIVMAHTGICMLTGDKFQIYHKYVEDIMGRPVWTHEMALDSIADEIRAKSKDDFIALCADESSSENPNKWIPVSERLPKKATRVLTSWVYVPTGAKYIEVAERWGDDDDYTFYGDTDEYKMNRKDHKVIAWMPLPQAYKAESEEQRMIVNICGIPHKVIECEDNFNVDAHFGQIDYMACEIRINKDMTQESKNETLCHEMLHGIFVHLGYSNYAQDEQLVQALGNAIYQGFNIKAESEEKK